MKSLKTGFLIVAILSSLTVNAQWWGNWGSGIVGEGPIVEKTLDEDDFTGIALSVPAHVELRQGNKQSIVVKGQQNIIDNLKTRVKGNTWHIGFEKGVRNHDKLKFYITIPTLEKASIHGSGKIEGKGRWSNLEDLDCSIHGSGDIILDVDSKNVACSIHGSGDIRLSGQTKYHEVKIHGSGDVRNAALSATHGAVKIYGSGTAKIAVQKDLDVSIHGSGDVYYKGSPSLETSIHGSGNVRSLK